MAINRPSFKDAPARGSKRKAGVSKGKAVVAQRRGVQRSAEFSRVVALPRRTLETYDEAFARVLSEQIRRDGSDFSLKIHQAAMLIEAVEAGGLFGMVGVGAGKTYIAALFGLVLDMWPVVVIVPPEIKHEILTRVIPHLKKHIEFKTPIVLSYNDISDPKKDDILERHAPKLIVADEVHCLKNKGTSRWKRVDRYFDANPETVFVALSGTITSRSLMDFWHIIQLTHKGWRCPVTRSWNDAKDWALALDPHVKEEQRLRPGVLLELCQPGEKPREGFRRRLVETEGVIGSKAEEFGASLIIRKLGLDIPKSVENALAYLRKFWEMPNGEVITDAKDFARKARELACGFYYVWDWENGEPDKEWLEARSMWRKTVANITKLNRKGLDSEKLVREAAIREVKGKFNDKYARIPKASRKESMQAWEAWSAVRHRTKPKTRDIWIDDFVVRAAIEWGERAESGLIWYDSRAIERRAGELGARVFAAGSNEALMNLSETKGDDVVFVSRAHGTGKNLQHKWYKNLVTAPWSGGKKWEQTVGRTHRQGQKSDEVIVDVFVHTPELEASLEKAIEDAHYISELSVEQKLIRATWLDERVK
jgi:hypothetical protein